MANNRLYIVDNETKEEILLAKGWGEGWILYDMDKVQDWLIGRDMGSSSRHNIPTNLSLKIE